MVRTQRNFGEDLNGEQRRNGTRKKAGRRLNVATWNVRTLVEDQGDPKIARKRPSTILSDTVVDRKFEFLTAELKRFNVAVAAIQETKWFGSDVWSSSGFTMLHSGRDLPRAEDESARRNEGVGLVLNMEMTNAWKNAGREWTAVSSRIVVARFKLADSGDHFASGRWTRRSDLFLTIVSVYAPTSKASMPTKNRFYSDLQRTLDGIPASDLQIVLGDFNARVGSRDTVCDDLWSGVRGGFGHGQCNSAGERLLMWCAINQFSVMNTWFRKPPHRRGTWMHPATKQHHMIDMVLMRQSQRWHCQDVTVMRGANCFTDHYMVRAKLRVDVRRPRGHRASGQRPPAVEMLREPSVCEQFKQQLATSLHQRPSQQSAEDEWAVLRDCVREVSDKVLGERKRIQPDWFVESNATLQPMIDAKNKANDEMLQKGTRSARRKFRESQRSVAGAVCRAREDWIERVSAEAEKCETAGGAQWRCIRRLQSLHLGRQPARVTSVVDEQGNTLTTSADIQDRWFRHFGNVLNVESQFDAGIVESLPDAPLRPELDNPPSESEMLAAMRMMKAGKAGGESGILPEMIICGGKELHTRLLELLRLVWAESAVVSDWRDAVIVPIPKKGNLKLCDNWRGISLLDVVGKLFARILQDRLQGLAEDILPESQSGFRKGRGCADMVFVARQLMEKSIEHNTPLYVLFVDLRKAYDSIPRPALWILLRKLGVPPTMLDLVRSLHESMQVRVRAEGGVTEAINVNNGLRQGCTLAPVLFNIYFSAVVGYWRSMCPDVGVDVRYKMGRKLVGDRTVKSRLQCTTITESQFADDAAIYATTRESFSRCTEAFVTCAAQWGLTVSLAKTKCMSINAPSNDPVHWGNSTIEAVDSFPYLGSVIHRDGLSTHDVMARIAKASRVFGSLRAPVFENRSLSLRCRRRVYVALVLPTLLYGAETWTPMAPDLRRLNVFHHQCVRIIVGISRRQQWDDRVTSATLAQALKIDCDIGDIIREHRLRWLGHIARMEDIRLPKRVMFGELPATRPRHGPRKRWRDVIMEDLDRLAPPMPADKWYATAQDRPAWRKVAHRRPLPRVVDGPEFRCVCGKICRRSGDLKRHTPFCRVASG